MGITLEQKLDCLTGAEYDAIEGIVDIILMNRKDRKSFSDGYLCEECKELTKPAKPADATQMICYGTQSGECNTSLCDRAHPHKRNERCKYPCEGIVKYHCVPVNKDKKGVREDG